MHEPDYIDRTIATVRLHADEKDNCWPQWANIFADEIEDLRARLAAFEAGLVETWAERDYVYECSRRRLKPRWDALDEDVREEWLEDARLQVVALTTSPPTSPLCVCRPDESFCGAWDCRHGSPAQLGLARQAWS